MKMKKNVVHMSIVAVIGTTAMAAMSSVQSATLNNGDILTIDAGQVVLDPSYGTVVNVTSGSYLGGDFNANNAIGFYESIAIPGPGTTGIVVGQATTPGAHHSGAPIAGDTNEIGDPFLGLANSTTSFWTSVGITGGTTNGLNFSGWTMAWGTISAVTLGSGAWQPADCAGSICNGTFVDGVAHFTWDGIYGNTYIIDYTASVPLGDPSGTGGQQYYYRLTGTVEAAVVPIPAAIWLFGSGLIGLIGIARRKKI